MAGINGYVRVHRLVLYQKMDMKLHKSGLLFIKEEPKFLLYNQIYNKNRWFPARTIKV